MDDIRYIQLQPPSYDSLQANYGRQPQAFDPTKAPSVSQYTPTEEGSPGTTPNLVDFAWFPGHDHFPMSRHTLLHLDYTSTVEISQQDLMELSPRTSLMELTGLSPIQEESHLEWLPINDASDPHPHERQRSSSNPQVKTKSAEARERRKHQNRRAQAAHRARREERQEQLRVQMHDLKQQHAATLRESKELQEQLAQLREENSLLKKCIEANSPATDNDFVFSLPWQED